MIEKYFDIGIVSFMAYPELGDESLSISQFEKKLKTITKDPFFNLLEINPIENEQKRNIIKKHISQSGMEIGYGGQGTVLKNKLNPNSLDEEERMQAVEMLKADIKNASDIGSKIYTFISGKWDVENRNEQLEQLVKSTVSLCKEAAKYDIFVQMELFDFDFDKKVLIGPATLALDLAKKVRSHVSNFGLMVDLSHFPQTKETSAFILNALRAYITHIHIGNVVLKEDSPACGDLHPRFGYPHSENYIDELLDFFQNLKKNGFFMDSTQKMRLSFEVKPQQDEDPLLIMNNSKRVLKRVWSLL